MKTPCLGVPLCRLPPLGRVVAHCALLAPALLVAWASGVCTHQAAFSLWGPFCIVSWWAQAHACGQHGAPPGWRGVTWIRPPDGERIHSDFELN